MALAFLSLLGLLHWNQVLLTSDQIFSASDANVGWLTAKKVNYESGMWGHYNASPLLGNSGSRLPGGSEWPLLVLSPVTYNNLIYALLLIGASFFLYLYLRLFEIHWMAALTGAVIGLWTGSITMTAAGHIGKFGVAFFGCASLFLIEKALRASGKRCVCLAVLAGGTIGAMLLEQQDVGLLWGLLLGAYTLFRLCQTVKTSGYIKGLQILVPIAVVGLLLAGAPALNMYERNVTDASTVKVDDKKSADSKWNYITQWSFPPSEIADLAAPGLMGLQTGHAESPYWGEIGQSEGWKSSGQGFRNFKLDSVYIGILPLMFACWAIIRFRQNGERKPLILFFAIAALVAFLLSCGKYTPIYKLFYSLPLVNNIRAPIKFMQLFQLMVGILAAFGLNAVLHDEREEKGVRRFWIALAALAGCFLAAALVIILGKQGWHQHFSGKGWGSAASALTSNMAGALVHAAGVAAIGCIFVWAVRWRSWRQYVLGALLVIIALDGWMLTRSYFKSVPLATYESPDAVLDFLEERAGDERVYLFDSSGMHNRWVGIDFRYRSINHFNIFQMPRMAEDYKRWLETVQHPLRLMQLSSVRYVSMPVQTWGSIEQQKDFANLFNPLFFYGFAQPRPQVIVSVQTDRSRASHVLLEYKANVPRISIKSSWTQVDDLTACAMLKAPSFDPGTTALVSEDTGAAIPAVFQGIGRGEISNINLDTKQASVRVQVEHPSIVMFTQKYMDGWVVRVDGEPQPLLKCNYLCMGVWVDSGAHDVTFSYEPQNAGVRLQVAGLLLVGSALLTLVFIRDR